MKRALYAAAATSVVVLSGAVACDDASGPQNERISMALAVADSRATSGGEVSLLGSDPDDPIVIVRGRQRLRLDVVTLNLTRVDLRRVESSNDEDTDLDTDTDFDTDTDSDTDTDGGDADFIRFRGPVTVDLPLRGGVIAPFATLVPVGTYDRVRFRVESARIVGAYDEDFDGEFEPNELFNEIVPIRHDFTLRINPPLVVTDGNASNVTIELRPPEWFRNRDRSLFNPRHLKNDNQLRARFRNVIRSTIRAFRDANGNGIDDRDTDGH